MNSCWENHQQMFDCPQQQVDGSNLPVVDGVDDDEGIRQVLQVVVVVVVVLFARLSFWQILGVELSSGLEPDLGLLSVQLLQADRMASIELTCLSADAGSHLRLARRQKLSRASGRVRVSVADFAGAARRHWNLQLVQLDRLAELVDVRLGLVVGCAQSESLIGFHVQVSIAARALLAVSLIGPRKTLVEGCVTTTQTGRAVLLVGLLVDVQMRHLRGDRVEPALHLGQVEQLVDWTSAEPGMDSGSGRLLRLRLAKLIRILLLQIAEPLATAHQLAQHLLLPVLEGGQLELVEELHETLDDRSLASLSGAHQQTGETLLVHVVQHEPVAVLVGSLVELIRHNR